MESLYRKYRPLTFESVVGQQHIVSTLEHAVNEGRLSHAYLFCGPRGTGKTTMARILAKALLCEKSEAARANGASGCMPDGSCPECEAIAEGTHPDVYELDAASRTGVDNVREEIINSVSFAPVRGKYKVYIIDEVHMLTTAAFNALLKTLEEPPSHVVFVLCTTDPQKLLETILSRCQRFDFHRISNDDLVGRMRYICEQEGFACDDEALEIVAKHARGGMRDALSTLEQLSVFGGGAVRASDARSLLGEVSSTVLAEFARAIAARDVVELFGLIRTQVDEGNDLMELTRDLVAHVRDVYTVCVAGTGRELLDCTPEEAAALADEARAFESADRMARVLTSLDDAALEMRNAADARLVLEIACTRLARPEADLTLEALAERLDRLEAQIAAGVASAPMNVSKLVGAPDAGAAAVAAAPKPTQAAAASAAPAAVGTARPKAQAAPGALPWEKPTAGSRTPAGADAPAESAAPVRPAAQPAAKPEAAPVAAAAAPASAHPVAAPAAHPAPPVSTPTEAAFAAAERADRAVQPASAPAAPVAEPAAPAPAAAASQPPATVSTPAVSDAGELQRKWADAVKRVTAAQASRGALLQSARAKSDDGSTLVVGLPAGSSFALKMLERADSKAIIVPIICEVFGTRAVEFAMEGGAAPKPTPAAPARPAPSTPAAPAPVVESAPAPSTPAPPAAIPSEARAAQTAPIAAPAQTAASAPVAAQTASGPETPPWVDAAPAGRVAPAPAAPIAADQASGPTVVPEPDVDAQRKAWEEDQVPYDDATIAAYEDEAADAAPVAPSSRVEATAPDSGFDPAPASQPGGAAAPTPAPDSQPAAAPAPAAPGALPWSGHVAQQQEDIPQTEEEAKALLGNVFGAGVIFKND